jgi:hypothetical protein
MDSMSEEPGRLLPLPEAAALLFGGVRGLDGRVRSSESENIRLRRMVARGQIKSQRVGKRIYILRAEIDKFTS